MAKKRYFVSFKASYEDHTYIAQYPSILASDSASAEHLAKMRLQDEYPDTYLDYETQYVVAI